jgi:hypothetical protein
MRTLLLTLSSAALVGGLWLSQPAAGTQQAPSRVIDRTLSCSVGLNGGVRKIKVNAQTGVRLFGQPSKWKFLASTGVSDPSGGGLAASVSAGNPLAPYQGYTFPPERLAYSMGASCRTARKIPLSSAALTGGEASQLVDHFDCVSGRRVFVRIRAVFSAPTSLKLKHYVNGTQLVAAGTVTEGRLAVRSAAGKPHAYAEVFESGKTRILTAPGCEED